MVGVAADVGDDAVALDDGDPTGVKTVAWTGGRMISWLSDIMSLLVIEYMHLAIPFCCLPQVTLSCPFSSIAQLAIGALYDPAA